MNQTEIVKLFGSEQECFQFYRRVLPERCPGDDLEDEIGPVLQDDREDLAERYLRREYCLGGVCVDMGGEFDWYAAPEGDLEWTCALARHHHITALSRGWRDSGDESYAAETVGLLTDWIERVGLPDIPADSFYHFLGDDYLILKRSHWRPLETAYRIGENWPLALANLMSSQSLTAERFSVILGSIHRQAVYLGKYRWKIGNHAFMEAAMLVCATLFFRELPGFDALRRSALSFLRENLDKMFFTDGYSREVSGGYNWVAKKGYVAVWLVAEKSGMLDEVFDSAIRRRLRGIFKAELYHLKPDLTVPVTNDSNYTASRRKQLRTIQQILNDPEIEWVLTEGNAGRAPLGTSHFYPDAGVCVMRSGWQRDALYGFFDAGKKGGHVIGDQLSFELSAYGFPFLANCGRWRYTTSSADLDWMDWARYFKSSASCNTVMPADCSQIPDDVREPRFCKEGDVEIASGIFDAGYQHADGRKFQVAHKREVLFVKPYFWLLRDTVFGDTTMPFEQHWHFVPPVEVKLHARGLYASRADVHLWLLQLESGDPVLDFGNEAAKRGWMCPDYARCEPAFEGFFSRTSPQEGCLFETLLFPVRGAGQVPPIFERSADAYHVAHGKQNWRVKIPWPGGSQY